MWLTLALTCVADLLRAGTRTSTDVLSVISMRNESTCVVDCQPMDWVLFNTLVGFLRSSEPAEGGNYAPAIQLAVGISLQQRPSPIRHIVN